MTITTYHIGLSFQTLRSEHMKKLLLFFMLCLASITVNAQDGEVKGTWMGKLNIFGNELPLVFHLDDNNCSIDSPDQGAKGIPANMERTENSIKVTVPSINATFEGVKTGKDIVGTFKQNGQSFPLTLKLGTLERRRPQTPTPPYPYNTQEVAFNNGEAVLKGTLVLPENYSKNTPVLLMVTGSGPQNRDEEMYGHKPFAVIADALARQGIATLRYDDRGFGKSTGDVVNATTEDFKNDALAGVELLRKQFNNVGILGHSEGGTIGLMLAVEGKVDFVVSLAAMAVSAENILVQQNRYIMEQAGFKSDVVENYCEALTRLFSDVKAGRNTDIEALTLPANLKQNLQLVANQMATPYFRHFLTLDISNCLHNITCPVLALNGTKDRQVDCEENLGILRKRLAGPKEIKAIDGVNHLFQHCDTGDTREYKEIEETFAPDAIQAIISFCLRIKQSPAKLINNIK